MISSLNRSYSKECIKNQLFDISSIFDIYAKSIVNVIIMVKPSISMSISTFLLFFDFHVLPKVDHRIDLFSVTLTKL